MMKTAEMMQFGDVMWGKLNPEVLFMFIGPSTISGSVRMYWVIPISGTPDGFWFVLNQPARSPIPVALEVLE